MVQDIPLKYVPEKQDFDIPSTDLASYSDVRNGLQEIQTDCLRDERQVGWTSLGELDTLCHPF